MATSYVMYNFEEERDALDLNTIKHGVEKVAFPGYLYGGEPFPLPQYVCGGDYSPAVIDTDQQYFFPNNRSEHPQHFSRFSYNYFPNSYGTGNWSRGYKTPAACCTGTYPEGNPPDCAPARFYSARYLSPYYADNQAYRAQRTKIL